MTVKLDDVEVLSDVSATGQERPWRDKKGEVIRYQFRSISSKKFWYSKEGEDIKFNLFGLYLVIKKGIKNSKNRKKDVC